MIKHHPQQALIASHAEARLPIAIAIAVSAHCEMCPQCQKQLEQFQQQLAEQTFGTNPLISEVNETELNKHDAEAQYDSTALCVDSLADDFDFDNLINEITAEPATDLIEYVATTVKVKQHNYQLPRAFKHQTKPDWQSMGKISRMRLNLDEGSSRASLLHIDAEGEIPEHSHQGQELTLLLAGEFSDHYHSYVAGDFILLDKAHHHSPKTMEGCLCYTVVDAPVHFTKGMSKLLNPIGKLIY